LSAPASTKGSPNAASWNATPVRTGAIDAAAGRTAAVTPAARARSAAGTSANVYAWRVGTSICESAKRASNTAAASGKVGMNGTSSNSTLDGRCVNTIVLSKPMRAATRSASKNEIAASRFAAKSSGPIVCGPTPKRSVNQYAMNAWTTNPPANASTAKSAASRSTMPGIRRRGSGGAPDRWTSGRDQATANTTAPARP
jgi:hypothetical protein